MRPNRVGADHRARPWAAGFAAAAAAALAAVGCTVKPAPPLWQQTHFSSVAVLPARVVVSTGAPPFTSPDTDRSTRVGDAIQQAAAVALVQKGYDVLPPLDVNERLTSDRALGERFMSLAAGFGMVPDANLPPDAMDRALSDAAPLGEGLGADLLVLVRGDGEYHSAGETILQGVLRGVLTKGREGYQPPPSTLSCDIFFIDPRNRARLARVDAVGISYSEDIPVLARHMLRRMARVPTGPKAPPATK